MGTIEYDLSQVSPLYETHAEPQPATYSPEAVTTTSTIEVIIEKRHRLDWRGKLVLQIRETYLAVDNRDAFDFGHNEIRWRDATLSDLNVGVV